MSLRKLTRCDYCGAEETLPFTCNYCQKNFCPDHRLPETHGCANLWMAKPPSEKTYGETPYTATGSYSGNYTWEYRPRRILWFGASELKHIAVGSILVMLVGLSLTRLTAPVWLLGFISIIFFAAFTLHELAHKFVAQRHGLWAEFRVQPMGALITLISVVSPFKLIAPGAVVIQGHAESKVMGRVAVAGPLTNFAMAAILLTSSWILPLDQILYYGAYINLLIGVFNLIPIGILDGQKVMSWNMKAWALLFAVSLISLVIVYQSLPR